MTEIAEPVTDAAPDGVRHLTTAELMAALPGVLTAPRGSGTVELVVRRPAVDSREEVEAGVLDPVVGLVGDDWVDLPSKATPDGSPHPGRQLTLMSSRFVDLVAGSRDHWALAGDQLYVDLDLSEEALPVGTRLRLGTAVVEITDQPHTGCAKFAARFGRDAHRLVWSDEGRALRLRGVYARVVGAGEVRPGDQVAVV
jgi:MOSC domain-containing protein YiiM